ncbi:hypothetical protein NDU88_003210 [Pleurodeles waltl]|uniref:Uncharacterized protein n=1 Tax=Pleurodeles waltl TaxID=8319 RepID=A0AAV7P8V7_PLEWA|nr:hypothetical protein NDU88_003210 [Pleurodeles waltl]
MPPARVQKNQHCREDPRRLQQCGHPEMTFLHPYSYACRENPEAPADCDCPVTRTRCLEEALHPQPPSPRETNYWCRSDQQAALIVAQSVAGLRSRPVPCLHCQSDSRVSPWIST